MHTGKWYPGKGDNLVSSDGAKATTTMWANTVKSGDHAVRKSLAEERERGHQQFQTLLQLQSTTGGTTESDKHRGTWKGRAPLKGVFPEPAFGYARVEGNLDAVKEKKVFSDDDETRLILRRR